MCDHFFVRIRNIFKSKHTTAVDVLTAEEDGNPARNTNKSIKEIHGEFLAKSNIQVMNSILGRGAYSVVCLASMKGLTDFIAVKILTEKENEKDYVTEQLAREIVLWKKLCSVKPPNENILQFHKVLYDSQFTYILNEYAPNGDLANYLCGGYLSELKCKKIFKQILNGLSFCHKLNIAHRDIKVENILFSKTYTAKLADFTFATSDNPVNGQLLCGTAGHFSPEQIERIDYNPFISDVWALGLVLWAMLNGQLPFHSTNSKQLGEEIRCLINNLFDLQRNKHVSGTCQNLIRRMLDPLPTRRIQLSEIKAHKWMD